MKKKKKEKLIAAQMVHLALMLTPFVYAATDRTLHYDAPPVEAEEPARREVAMPELIELRPGETPELLEHLFDEAERTGADPEKMRWTIMYENHWTNRPSTLYYQFDDPRFGIVAGTPERSYGYCQINIDYNPDVTRAEAEDPYFCISWMADRFGENLGTRWSMYKKLYGNSPSTI